MDFIRRRRVQSWFGSDLWVRVGWLKSKRPANSLPGMALSWPLELQMGYASLNGAER